MSATAFIGGIGISLFGSTASNLGVNVQKYSQLLNNKKQQSERRGYLQQPLWWCGLSAVIIGAICDFGALSFAPQSVIMPVGSFTLVANVGFAHFWLGEKLGFSDLTGTLFIVIGATTIAVAYGALGELREENKVTSAEMMDLYKSWKVLGYGVCVVILLTTFYVISLQCEHLLRKISAVNKEKENGSSAIEGPSPSSSKSEDSVRGVDPLLAEIEDKEETGDLCIAMGKYHPCLARIAAHFSNYENLKRWHPLSYAAVSGIMGSFSVVYGKSIGMLIGNTFDGTSNEFAHPYIYVCIFCIIISVVSQTHFLALGLKYFDALFIVPVFQCFFITLSIFGGAIYWKETALFNSAQWIVFILGVLIVLWGVFLMSSREMTVDGVSAAPDGEDGDEGYVSLGGDVELSDEGPIPRSRPRHRSAAAIVETTLREAIMRPISVLIEPELLREDDYFGPNGTPDRAQRRSSVLRRRTTGKADAKVMGLLPVFLNPDLEEAGTALGFGLGFEDFGNAFSIRRRMDRQHAILDRRRRLVLRRRTMGTDSGARRRFVPSSLNMPSILERQRSNSDGLLTLSTTKSTESLVTFDKVDRSAGGDSGASDDDIDVPRADEASMIGKEEGANNADSDSDDEAPAPRSTRSNTFIL